MYQSKRVRIILGTMLAVLLAACAPHATTTPPPDQRAPQPVGKTIPQIPMRILIKFMNPASDNPQISNAVAASCHCQPLFLRMDRTDVLIYQITLPQNRTFEDFEKSMRQQAVSLQIEFIEQDSVMQSQ